MHKIASPQFRVVAIEGVIGDTRLSVADSQNLFYGLAAQARSLFIHLLEADSQGVDDCFNLPQQLEESQFYRRHEPWYLDYSVTGCLFGSNTDSQTAGVFHFHHISSP